MPLALKIGLPVAAALVLLWVAGNVALLIFAGILTAVLLRDAADHLEQWLHLPRGFGIPLALLIAVVVIGGTGWLLAPRIAVQIDQLMAAVPASMRQLQNSIERYKWGRTLLQSVPAPSNMISDSSAVLGRVSTVFTGVFGAVGNVLIVAFIGVYFSVHPKAYIEGVLKLAPQKARPRGREVMHELGKTLRLWLRGKVISMAIIGILTTIGLMVIGVPLALTIGLLAGLLDFIPYIGPALAAAPAVLIALSQDPVTALYVVLLFVVLQSIEGYLLLPLVEQRTVALLPGLIVIMQVLFGLAFGLIGVALATPATAVITVVTGMLYVQDVLGDRVKLPSGH